MCVCFCIPESCPGHNLAVHNGIWKKIGTNGHHDKAMCRELEPCRLVKGQGHSAHLNFVHRPVKPVHVRPITLLCMVGFENDLAQISIMIR